MDSTQRALTPRMVFAYLGIGAASGILSGLFGVGGGTVIVPLLVMLLAFDQRLAAGTSLAAIAISASAGVVSYALADSVAWIPALILAVGAVIGAQIGTWMLPRISQTVLRWFFVGFLIAVIVSLFLVIPARDAVLELHLGSALGLALVGILTGILAGLIGVGGGIVVVPVLILVFGASDLVAKGTSLLMMIPTALSGTLGNYRRRNVNLVAAGIIGAAGAATTTLGAWVARLVDPFTANVLFAVFLTAITAQMAVRAVKGRKG
ncbi:MAG: sulfite exporter TauE/SafE family protein [Ruaniaceae bacterium]|nr:sulfite exporter TauE/SafE family protein [Ruaniaceae bacterium]